MNIITLKNLTKSYGSNVVVDNLTLDIVHGEFLGFLGPNGAGKTTTIRMLTGITPQNSGEINYVGIKNGNKKEIAKIIGVIPESRGFYDWMTAEEYLDFFAQLYSIKDRKALIEELLEKVHLSDRKNSRVGEYSRGMKQRLGLARALINKPQVLFLDEPTLGLDPQGQEDIQKLLKKLNEDGVTIFYSSHLLNEVSALCTKVAIINHGKLVALGTIDELKQKANVKENNLTDIFLELTKN